MSRKFIAFMTGIVTLLLSFRWVVSVKPELLTENVLLSYNIGFVVLVLVYGFQNFLNNLLKSKYFSIKRFQGDQK